MLCHHTHVFARSNIVVIYDKEYVTIIGCTALFENTLFLGTTVASPFVINASPLEPIAKSQFTKTVMFKYKNYDQFIHMSISVLVTMTFQINAATSF